MSPGNVARRMGGVVTELKAVETLPPPAKAQEILSIKRKYFISAEGAYSSLVFKTRKHNVLITGRMLSDKNTRPVMWKVESLLRSISFSLCVIWKHNVNCLFYYRLELSCGVLVHTPISACLIHPLRVPPSDQCLIPFRLCHLKRYVHRETVYW